MKGLFLLFILGATTNLFAQNFSISGEISGNREPFIYISYKNGADTAKIENGRFHLKGNISEPVEAVLHFSHYPMAAEFQVTRTFMLEPGNMQITVKGKNLRGAVITGSVSERESQYLDSMRRAVGAQTALLSAKYDVAEAAWEKDIDNDSLKANMSAIHDQLKTYDNKIQLLTLDFIRTHPDSYISAAQLRTFLKILSLSSLQEMYNGFSERVKESTDGKAIRAELEVITGALPGHEAADFSTYDIHSNPLQLSSFRDSVVLLDFWASWCVPCRVGNPHLIALYNKYHAEGFTIIGIADQDKDTNVYYKAIEKDKIGIWHHVLRGKLWPQFAVFSIPVKILIDKKGVIVGRYGEGDEAALDKKLEEIL